MVAVLFSSGRGLNNLELNACPYNTVIALRFSLKVKTKNIKYSHVEEHG